MSTSPYNSPQMPAEKKKGSKTLWIILGIVGVTLFGTCACCSGVAYFGTGVVSDEFGKQIALQYSDDPIVVRQLGGIDSCSMNTWATWQHEDEEMFVFDVKGPKGSGQIEAKQSRGAGIRFESAKLILEQSSWVLSQ